MFSLLFFLSKFKYAYIFSLDHCVHFCFYQYLWLVVKSTSEIQNGLPFSSSLNEVGSQVSYCAALNLAQEVGTRRHWVPDLYCEDYLRNRVEGHQYILDYDIAIDIIARQLPELPVKGDGLDLIVLDIDETALSNLPYYKEHRYGYGPVLSFSFSKF